MYYDKFLTILSDLCQILRCFTAVSACRSREFALMKSYFPDTARKVQEKVEEECQLLDYEGSRLYDEHPDRLMMRRPLQADPFVQVDGGTGSCRRFRIDFLDDLIQVLLYQEISRRRRCRRRRCRGF